MPRQHGACLNGQVGETALTAAQGRFIRPEPSSQTGRHQATHSISTQPQELSNVFPHLILKLLFLNNHGWLGHPGRITGAVKGWALL